MSKIGQTKSKIFAIIASENITPTQISHKLGLNLSTVSQHIKELVAMGAIEEIRNEHFKKFKLYKVNPSFDQNILLIDEDAQKMGNLKRDAILYSAIILFAAAATYLLFFANSANYSSGRTVSIALTDPPTVPNGTQALYANYYSIAVHVIHNGTSNWVVSNVTSSAGTVNLLALTNYSQILDKINAPPNSRVDLVRFDMPSAQIVINGTEYDLALRNEQLVTSVSGDQNISSDKEILVDLSSTVVPMYINGLNVFVMLPQVGSVAINQSESQSTADIGSLSKLNYSQLMLLYSLNDNMSISNVSLTPQNDSTEFSATIKNEGNKTVALKSILVLGPQYLLNESGVVFNSTSLIPVESKHKAVEFIVGDNGTLQFANEQYVLSSLDRINYTYPSSPYGYSLSPNQSVTLKFQGELNLSNGLDISLLNNTNYKISVLGNNILHLTQNITSS